MDDDDVVIDIRERLLERKRDRALAELADGVLNTVLSNNPRVVERRLRPRAVRCAEQAGIFSALTLEDYEDAEAALDTALALVRTMRGLAGFGGQNG